MKHEQNIRERIITHLGIEQATPEEQDRLIDEITMQAYSRVSSQFDKLLTEEQLQEVDKKREADVDPQEIMAWAEDQIPEFDEILAHAMTDVIDELSQNLQAVKKQIDT